MSEKEPNLIRHVRTNLVENLRRIPGRVGDVITPPKSSILERFTLLALDTSVIAGTISFARPDIPVEVALLGGLALPWDIYLRYRFIRRR